VEWCARIGGGGGGGSGKKQEAMAREEVVPRGARCQVVVIGDRGTGKSSLIIAVATDSFPDKAPPVLPPTRLPHDFYPDRVPLTIVDTSSRQEDKMKLEMEVKKADAIVLTYSCDRAQTLDRLSTYWLPELRRLEVSCLSFLSCSMPLPLVYLRGRQSKLLVIFFFCCVLLMLYVPLVDQSASHCCWMQVRSP
jgi:hypothetical protein